MKTYITIILLFCILIYPLAPFFTTSVSASAVGEKGFTRENAVRLAQGIATLYLLHTINKLIAGNKDEDINEQESIVQNNKFRDKVIVIDPGHGGFDPGAVGPSDLKEKDVNLNIALKLYDILKNAGSNVYLTRDKDVFVPLEKRADMANELDADIFISVHCNAEKKGVERGIETYAHYNTSSETWSLAWNLQNSLVRQMKLNDRGLKANNFHVIRKTKDIKSVLLEIGYISNSKEEALLSENKKTEEIAQAIYQGILDYYSS